MLTKTRVYSCGWDEQGRTLFDSRHSMLRLAIIISLIIALASTQWTNAGFASISPSAKDPELVYLREFDLPKSAPRAHSIRFAAKNEEWTVGKEDAETTGREFKLIKTKLEEMKGMQQRKKGTRLIIDNESEFAGSTDS